MMAKTEQEIKISKALGLEAAAELYKDKYDLLAAFKLKKICESIIDCVDGTDEKYNCLFLKAVSIYTWVIKEDSSFVFRVSEVKEICEFILRGFKLKGERKKK